MIKDITTLANYKILLVILAFLAALLSSCAAIAFEDHPCFLLYTYIYIYIYIFNRTRTTHFNVNFHTII